MDDPTGNWYLRPLVVMLLVPALVLSYQYLTLDIVDPTTFASLVIDRGITVLIVLAFVAVLVNLFAPAPWHGYAGLVACGISILVACSVLLAGIRPPQDWTEFLLAVVALVFALLAGAFLIGTFGWPIHQARTTAALAAVVALLLPGLELWHTTSFSAFTNKASLTLTPSATVQSATKDRYRVQVSFTADNQSDVRVRVLASNMKICWWQPGQNKEFDTDPDGDRDNCLGWRPVGWRSWIDGDSPLTVSRTIRVPRSSPQLIIRSSVTYARGDRLQLVDSDDADSRKLPGCVGSADLYRLDEESRYKALAQQDKYLVYAVAGDSPNVRLFLESDEDLACNSDTSRLEAYYGMSTTRVVNSFWLSPKAG